MKKRVIIIEMPDELKDDDVLYIIESALCGDDIYAMFAPKLAEIHGDDGITFNGVWK